MKTIWIIDHYSSEPKYGGISRQYDFATELAKRGYNVVIFSSSFSHFTHKYFSDEECYISNINKNVHYVYLRTSSYEKNGGLQRFKNMLSFITMVKKYRKYIVDKFGIPDVVTACSVHPFTWVVGYTSSKKYKSKFCIEVRDLWPIVWVLKGDKSKSHPMVIFFGLLEKWAYKKADRIIYSMAYGDRYICDELGIEKNKVCLIGQPMDCERFDKNADTKVSMIPNEIREFMKDSFVCAFTGYYMDYEGVYTMLESAKILKQKDIPVKMIFVGSGEEYEGMKKYAFDNGLNNVFVGPRVSKECIPSILKASKVCMVQLSHPGHQLTYKYGVSKNKVNEYLYSGACIIYGFFDKNDIVATSGAGYVIEPFNAIELASKIQDVYQMKDDKREEFGVNGRKYIDDNHRVQVLVDKLEYLFK